MGNQIAHWEIGGPDRTVLSDFYERVFGWTVDANNPMDYGIVTKAEGGIGGGIMKTPDGSALVTVYAFCPDGVGAKLKEAEAAGATIVLEEHSIPDGPTIGAFVDPFGHLIGLFHGEGDAPAGGSGAPVVWWEIIGGADAATLRDFYAGLFGWTYTVHEATDYGEVNVGVEGAVGGGIGKSPDGSPSVTIYPAVDDLAATLEAVAAAGGTTVVPPMQVPGGPMIAQFADPAGNVIGLVKNA